MISGDEFVRAVRKIDYEVDHMTRQPHDPKVRVASASVSAAP